MLLNRPVVALSMGWFVAIAAMLGLRAGFVLPPASMTEVVLWLLLASVPPIVLIAIARGAPPPTIAKILYDTEQHAPVVAPRSSSDAGHD